MSRIIRAELLRLVRRRTVVIAGAGALLFAVVATLTVFSSAKSTGIANSRQGGTTLAKLAESGGATQAFAVGASFAGFLVFVTFIAVVAAEFCGGTFRALLLRDPHRRRVIVGKVIGLLIVAAGVAMLAEVFSVGHVAGRWHRARTCRRRHGSRSPGSATRSATSSRSSPAWLVGRCSARPSLSIFRSAPLALGVGFAWAGPFENIVVDSWRHRIPVLPRPGAGVTDSWRHRRARLRPGTAHRRPLHRGRGRGHLVPRFPKGCHSMNSGRY